MFWLMASTEVGDIRAGRTTILGPEGGWGATNSLGLTSAWRTLAEIVFKTSTTGINMSDLELPCKIWLFRNLHGLLSLSLVDSQTTLVDTDTASYCNCSDMIRYRQMMSDLSDTYLLKSLDTFDFDALDNERLALVPCEGPVQLCNGAPSNLVQPERTSNHCG